MNKRNLKRVLSLILVLTMLAGISITGHAAGNGKDIVYLYNEGVVNRQTEVKVLELVNAERAKASLPPLKMSEELQDVAEQRAFEQIALFSHTRPDGTPCFSALEETDIYTMATDMGENIARGYNSANAVMTAWMNSEGHRDNILEPKYTHIGIGCFEYLGRYYWTQTFIATGEDVPEVRPTEPDGMEVEGAMEVSYKTLKANSEYLNAAGSLSIKQDDYSIEIGEEDGAAAGLWVGTFFIGAIFGEGLDVKSSDESIIRPDEEGGFTLLKTGTATITINWQGLSCSYKVTVTEKGCEHNYEEVITPATCTTNGKKEYVCTKCQKVDTARTVVIPKTGHSYQETRVEPTCEKAGSITKVCANCGDKRTETIPAKGHTPGAWETVTAAGCTTTGLEVRKCTSCNTQMESRVIDATGHQYGEWEIVKEATFYEDGEKQHICANCSDVEKVRIPKRSENHNHSFTGAEEIIKEATCTEAGSKIVHCAEPECTETEIQIIPAKGHVKGEWIVTEEPTCTKTGKQIQKCTVCDTLLEEKVIEMLPHTVDEWNVTKEPTRSETGSKEGICTSCGEKIVVEIPVLPPYKIVSGANSVNTIGKISSVTITADGSIEDFVALKIDGKELESENYTVGSESTVIELKKEYLKTLSVGKHVVTFVYTDGEVSTDLTIAEETPVKEEIGTAVTDKAINNNKTTTKAVKTGDATQVMLYMILGAASVMAVVTAKKKRIF